MDGKKEEYCLRAENIRLHGAQLHRGGPSLNTPYQEDPTKFFRASRVFVLFPSFIERLHPSDSKSLGCGCNNVITVHHGVGFLVFIANKDIEDEASPQISGGYEPI
ncbi:MAG: hypothetical protein HY881_16305 [Deltaproteobacteria bacterium]|nr:hypothetical protein [Deltaproteobacteria bacterium]